MPVRLLNSSVLTWPDRATVERALRAWAQEEIPRHSGVVQIGYFGSYARGDWGVGSDIDLIAVLADSAEPLPGNSHSCRFLHNSWFTRQTNGTSCSKKKDALFARLNVKRSGSFGLDLTTAVHFLCLRVFVVSAAKPIPPGHKDAKKHQGLFEIQTIDEPCYLS